MGKIMHGGIEYSGGGGGGGGGASTLAELTDVELVEPEDGQLLRYDEETQKWENYTPESSRASEIINITAGNGTSSRTFTFPQKPKKVSVTYNSADANPWLGHWEFIWGDDVAIGIANARGNPGTGGTICRVNLSYGSSGKSVTVTAFNAFQAWNLASGNQGHFFVEY